MRLLIAPALFSTWLILGSLKVGHGVGILSVTPSLGHGVGRGREGRGRSAELRLAQKVIAAMIVSGKKSTVGGGLLVGFPALLALAILVGVILNKRGILNDERGDNHDELRRHFGMVDAQAPSLLPIDDKWQKLDERW